jgi:hypothetical protein
MWWLDWSWWCVGGVALEQRHGGRVHGRCDDYPGAIEHHRHGRTAPAPAVQITLVVPAVHDPPEYVYFAKFTDSEPSHHTMYRCGVEPWIAFSSLAV